MHVIEIIKTGIMVFFQLLELPGLITFFSLFMYKTRQTRQFRQQIEMKAMYNVMNRN